LRDLTQHLTTQADNNHAPPVFAFSRAFFSFKKIHGMSILKMKGKVFDKFKAYKALVEIQTDMNNKAF
jgi:hypothetical protein